MRRFLLLILTFSSLAQSAHAQMPKERWEGYRPIEELRTLNLPFQEFAENAVYFLETTGLTEKPGEKVEILDIKTDPRAQNKITDKKTLTYEPLHFQIETCRKQNLRYCPIFKVTTKATMFFNEGKFYTCRHNFHNWLALAAEANGVSVDLLSPPIILRTPNPKKPGKFIVIYQSAFDKEPLLQFSMINNDKRLNFQFDNADYPSRQHRELVYLLDFTEMTIKNTKHYGNYSLPVLPNGLESIEPNEEIFVVGYPARTNEFNGEPGDSSGLTLLASTGFILRQLPADIAIASTAYSSAGASGSAAFSNKGELLGVNCGGFKRRKPSDTTSYFLPLDKNAITEFWKQIDYSVLETK